VPFDETVYGSGKIFTADRARPWAERVRLQGDRVTAVGTRAEVRATRGAGIPEVAERPRSPAQGLDRVRVHAGCSAGVLAAASQADPT
jgi:hypothetical protein